MPELTVEQALWRLIKQDTCKKKLIILHNYSEYTGESDI